METLASKTNTGMEILRYKGKWFKINPKPYEPERQTIQIAWKQIKDPSVEPQQAYREYFARQREEMKILYPSFRKEDVD